MRIHINHANFHFLIDKLHQQKVAAGDFLL